MLRRDSLKLRRKRRRGRDGATEVTHATGLNELGVEGLRHPLHVLPDRIHSRHDLRDVGTRRTCGNGVAWRVVRRRHRHRWRERDGDVAEDADGLHRRHRPFRHGLVAIDAKGDVEKSVAAELHIAHVTDVDAGEQNGLPLLEALPPLKAGVEWISGGQAAAREPERADGQDSHRERDEDTDGHFVASSHA